MVESCALPEQMLWWSPLYFPNADLGPAALPASALPQVLGIELGWRGSAWVNAGVSAALRDSPHTLYSQILHTANLSTLIL